MRLATWTTLLSCALMLPEVERGQTEARSSLSDRYRVEGRKVAFPSSGAASRTVDLAEFETAYLSPSGQRLVIFDHEARKGRAFDPLGDETPFAADAGFSRLLVSDAGLVFAHSPVQKPQPRMDDVRLFDASGSQVWRSGRFLLGSVVARFSPDGQRLALVGTVEGEDDARDPTALLVEDGRETWSHGFPAAWSGLDVAFSPDGESVAFGMVAWDSGEDRIFVRDSARSGLLEIEVTGLGHHVSADALAFGPLGRRLVVNGLARVQAYDLALGSRVWSTELNAPQETANLLDGAVKLAVIGDRIVAAHQISAPEGRVRYAVSVLDGDGELLGKTVLAPPQPRRGVVGRFWDLVNEGSELLIHLEPDPVRIALP